MKILKTYRHIYVCEVCNSEYLTMLEAHDCLLKHKRQDEKEAEENERLARAALVEDSLTDVKCCVNCRWSGYGGFDYVDCSITGGEMYHGDPKVCDEYEED